MSCEILGGFIGGLYDSVAEGDVAVSCFFGLCEKKKRCEMTLLL